jgi:hypothetical protein
LTTEIGSCYGRFVLKTGNKEESVRRLAVLLVCACALPVSAARAWTWPVDGPVLRPFSFDHAHPYAGGQHRGVDLGAPGGTQVLAPIGGIVSFAGTVPTGGKTVSIETPLGYTATLVHLGTIGVKRGAPVGEGSVVGTVGPSGVPELTEPYVYFGLRTTSDQQGYVDPMVFLPPRTRAPPATGADAPAVTAVVGATSTAEAQAAEPVVAVITTVTAKAPAESVAGSPAASAPVAAPVSARVEPSAAGAVAEARPTSHARVDEEPGRSVSLGAAEVTLARVPVQVTQRHGVKAAPRHRQRPSPAESHDSRPAAGSSHGLQQQEAVQASRLVAAMTQPAASKESDHSWTFVLGALVLILALACAWRRRSAQKAARIMSLPKTETHVHVGEPIEEESPGGPSLAVRVRAETPGTCGGVRSPGGHLRAVPPLEGRRRPDGEWDGRARHAGDGYGRSRGRVAA